MALYSLTKNGNVIKCPYNCTKNHEHYQGTFDGALEFFGVKEVKNYGRLIDIIMYHQTSNRTAPKLSNELFYILVRAQGEHKYWAPKHEREKNAFEALELAERAGFIYDDKLVPILKESKRKAANDRVWAWEKWLESL